MILLAIHANAKFALKNEFVVVDFRDQMLAGAAGAQTCLMVGQAAALATDQLASLSRPATNVTFAEMCRRERGV
jgi:hypothetical protein